MYSYIPMTSINYFIALQENMVQVYIDMCTDLESAALYTLYPRRTWLINDDFQLILEDLEKSS